MKYIQLGNSDLKVSKVCLGCMGFGEAQRGMHSWTLPYQESKEIIKYALDKGINFFDTAMAYQGGTSEIFLGRAIKEYVDREDVVIATKYTPRTLEQINKGITAREHIEKCINDSLQRLDMDYIDLYILHMWDYHTPIEETMEILNDMINSGKIRYIGVSNCFAYQLAIANSVAKSHGWHQFISIQGHYNLIFREEEREMAKYCKEENIAMTPYSALASGRLAKHPGELSKRMKEDSFAKGKYDASIDNDLPIIQRVEQLAAQKKVSMTEISLSWLMSKVASPVVGATKKYHIDGAIKAVELELTDEEKIYLEELYKPHELVGVMAQNN
ncbi:MAG: aldo/keto reductase [Bacilli bacterium]|nr:aldo/keto reductase [Bacilli bacterium]